eukprot:c12644_g1_i1.p2 GENE.c12644_g1_i1~~c12644_g1_i1.p2  ORF type:complete len:564 (+),score=109.28 c12644_g1_i1:30-1721(+)
MKRLFALAVVLALAGIAAAKADEPVMMETDGATPDEAMARGHVDAGWARGPRAPANTRLTLTFAVRLDNVDAAMRELLAVSTPGSARYRQHLSLQEATELTVNAPRVAAVEAWLAAVFPEASLSREGMGSFVTAAGIRVADAERVLGAVLHVYRHGPSRLFAIRSAARYSLPASIASQVDFVAGMMRLPNVRPSGAAAAAAAPGDGIVVDPRLIRKNYDIGSTVGDGKSSSQAVAQFLGQRCGEADLDEFRTLFAQWSFGVDPTYVGPDKGLPGTEACLDLETIVGVGAHVPTVFWSTGGLDNGQEPFLVWAMNVSALSSPPNIFSVSYGDVESSLSTSFMQRVSTELGLLGSRGVSILFASGDSGVGCTGKTFEPNFPASAPTVTTVGGTALGLLESGPEFCNGLSGGGFSNVFSMPEYQADAVAAYMSLNSSYIPPAKYYNATGRAYPDISALSSGFIIVIDGIPMPGVAGTSCASPTSAAVFSLVNNLLMAKGEPPLGFLNPMIYSRLLGSQGLFDVTQGGNPPQGGGCGGQCFFAAPGWDACSGGGAPRYAGIVSVLSS